MYDPNARHPTSQQREWMRALADLRGGDWESPRDEDGPGEEDDREFFRLDAECRALEAELGTIGDPAGATPDDARELERLRGLAREELRFTHVDAARSKIAELRRLVQRIQERAQREGARPAAGGSPASSPPPSPLASSSSPPSPSPSPSSPVATRADAGERERDPRALLLALGEAVQKKEIEEAKRLHAEAQRRGVEIPGLLRIRLVSLGVMSRGQESTADFRIDAREAEPHARERHTRAGILRAGRVLTDHPERVAIFADEEAFTRALRGAPTERAAWRPSSTPGRYDARVDGVHYQGVLLGDTMSLFSFYPVGRGALEVPRRRLELLLERYSRLDAAAFWAAVEQAPRQLAAVADRLRELVAPDGASEDERRRIEELRAAVEQALAEQDPVASVRTLNTLAEAREAARQAVLRRAAAGDH